MMKALMADVHRIYGSSSFSKLIIQILINPKFRPIFSYRVGRALMTLPRLPRIALLPIIRLIHRFFCAQAVMELPLIANIGPGLLIFHSYGIIINSGATVGSNATLLHQVTIGGTKKGIPRIGDNVTLAAGAMVLGPVVIGDGVTIGAATVVLADVPDGAIVVGNPHRVIRIENVPRTPNPAPL